MMRAGALPCVMLALWGSSCATGAPVGGRLALAEGYEPFARAAPRVIPAPGSAEAWLPVRPGARADVVALARRLVGAKQVVIGGRRYGDDCSGFVRALFDPVGIDLMSRAEPGDNGVTAMWRFAGRHGRVFASGRPLPGDLVFFRDTADANRDGAVNDGLTHVGVVEDVTASGTVMVVHRVARGVVRSPMTLATPDVVRGPDGRVVNDWIRRAGHDGRPRLTAELFAGYGTLLPVEAHIAGR